MINRKEIKIGLVSLGCDKNRVDSEQILGKLSAGGFTVTPDAENADVIIVNTCAFILPAREESVNTVLEMAEYKTHGKCRKLVVTGCLPEKYKDELIEGFPEVDCFLGINDYENIASIIERLFESEDIISGDENSEEIICGQRILTTPKHYAYLKIADGCDNFCTYCTIPSIRGKYRSYPMEKLVSEAEVLAEGGAEELILVAQDVTNYGMDVYGKYSIVELIRRISAIDKVKRIRLLYCYPERINDELIAEMRDNQKVMKYIDIPMQHISSRVLRLMGRRSDKEELCALMEKLRENIPEIAIRSTFIIGFPSETEEDVDELIDFLEKYRLTNVGFFGYSLEEDTPSAKIKGRIDEDTIADRLERVSEAQYEIYSALAEEKIGKIYDVVIDDISELGEYFGRSFECAPDVDFNVIFTSQKEYKRGDCVRVEITGVDEYDLIGEAL